VRDPGIPPQDDCNDRNEAAGPRLIPRVAFGVSVAVLAGVVIVTIPSAYPGPAGSGPIMTTTALGGVIDGIGTGTPLTNETACCA
jgi:hypothetical protein